MRRGKGSSGKDRPVFDGSVLDAVNRPGDLTGLDRADLALLADEIRTVIIETVSQNGGHLASNLGIVELTCCLERVFSDEKDRIIFDVGHQCYTHKLLTGRKERFSSLRKKDGISGFLRPCESEYDAVVSGHSSTALSSALGIATAKKLSGEGGNVVAVIGDGAMTGGMFYEALNNVAGSAAKVVIVINNNEMSISPNVGGVAKHLAKITSRTSYFAFKDFTEKLIKAIPLIGRPIFKFLVYVRDSLKMLITRGNIFSDMGVSYLGPVDGHDIKQLLAVFNRAKKLQKSVVVHCKTVKGKGFTDAEALPEKYHSMSPFSLLHEDEKDVHLHASDCFSNVLGMELVRLAGQDKRICAVTASMCEGTGLSAFMKLYPERFFDVGIAEQHAVTFCAGLAKGGSVPFFCVYSSFLQRAYDQLVHDVAIEGLHVVFCVDRAGFVGEDGETHNGMFDLAFLSSVPGFTIYSPSGYNELRYCVERAVRQDGPVVIRYPRGAAGPVWDIADRPPYGDFRLFDGEDCLLVSYGRVFNEVCGAAERLREKGINAGLLKLLRVSPLPGEIAGIISRYRYVFVFEESVSEGSVGQKISALPPMEGFAGKRRVICRAADGFISQRSTRECFADCGLDREAIFTLVSDEIAGGRRDED